MSHLNTNIAPSDIMLSDEQEAQFALYRDLLLSWNERLNLTAIRTPDGVEQRHFRDSLSCVDATGNLNGRRLIDIGTGAGFPGLPLKILFPDLQLTLVESVAKKTRFLKDVVTTLELTQVSILTERAEIIGQQPSQREQYDWAVSRAVAELRVLVEYLLPLCRVGGFVLAQKGIRAETEIELARHAIATLGGGDVESLSVPGGEQDARGSLLVIPKIDNTPVNYPRRVGVPLKRPL